MPDTINRIIAGRRCPRGHAWDQIGSSLGMSADAVRKRHSRACGAGVEASNECPVCGGISPNLDFNNVEGLSFEECGNVATLRATLADPGNIHDLDTLLELCKVDLGTWRVLDWGVKQWAVGAKDKQGQLNWEDGKIVDGHLRYHGVSVTPLWSVWAKFVRIVPVPVVPEIRPVVSAIAPVVCSKPVGDGLQTCLVGADGHVGYRKNGSLVPFHNRRAVHAFLQVAAFIQPDQIVLAGDWTDAPELSDKYLRDPDMVGVLQPAIAEGHWIRHQLRLLCPSSKIYEMCGNHEDRLRKYLVARAPSVYGLRAANCEVAALSWAALLDLPGLGIEWMDGYPDNQLWLADHAMVYHGDVVSNVPGGTARKVLEKYEDVKTVFGHIHRRERANQTRRRRDGRVMGEAVAVGTLADLDGPIPAQGHDLNWQNSFGVVCYDGSDAEIYDVGVSQVGVAFWNGLRFEGEDYVSQLRADMPEFLW